MVDVTQALKDTENALRDFISFVLSKTLGTNWERTCGVSPDRFEKWEKRKTDEAARQESGAVDERLIYYADFYDLKTILQKQWQHFSPALGDWKTIEVMLSELEKLRDPDAHRRELLPHQKNLVLGICGEIRTKIARFRSKQETSESYYPTIEFIADNLGNSWKSGQKRQIRTGLTLRPGTELQFVVTASDPLGEQLEYAFSFDQGGFGNLLKWTHENTCSFLVIEDHVGKSFNANVSIRSKRKYHAHKDFDDWVFFIYEVLPPH
jgi:hypothetical protein